MSQEKRLTVWSWLLPLLAGALITMTTNIITSYSEERHKDRERYLEEGRLHFMRISQLTGEYHSVTSRLLEELSETASTEVPPLMKEYNEIIVKANSHELQYISLIQHLMGADAARRFEDRIVKPLKAFHKIIDRAISLGNKPELTENHREKLAAIKHEIIEFNSMFLDVVSGVKNQ